MISQQELNEWHDQFPDEGHPPKPTSVVARFQCNTVLVVGGVEQVGLTPVYSSDPAHPNHAWSKYTPAGSLLLSISNPDAQGVFEIGKEYEVLVTRVLPR